jgi:hypothetical protein
MSLVVCEQLGPVIGDQAISIAKAKNEKPEARTLSSCICRICRICILQKGYAEYVTMNLNMQNISQNMSNNM